ncbi:protein-L-isoaspartate(D-aspartate) O-methyltransferase [Planctomycetota bacterium]
MDKDSNSNDFADAREQMVRSHLKGRDITDPGVLKAMAQIPREEFLPEKYRSSAYLDGPLPIGMGQTISQSYIVALMTEHLKLTGGCEVLEIGTGCGYQTAVLASLAKKVYTIERLAQLSESAQAVLSRLGIDNVEFYIGDGSKGWPAEKTFDRIIVTAALPEIPQPLLDQLKTGGIVVAPVGGPVTQKLIAAKKKTVGTTENLICDVRFVKIIGEYGFPE